MKHNLLPIFILSIISLVGCQNKNNNSFKDPDTTPNWFEELKDFTIPSKYVLGDSINNDSLIHVYFKYKQLINGYEVTGKWFPYDKYSETGFVLMYFKNEETGFKMGYIEPKYSSYDIDKIMLAKDFIGHQNDSIYLLDYTSPDTTDYFKDINGYSPISFYSPFQFLDVDFDGTDELLISDWGQTQAGNHYDVIKILDNNDTEKLDYMPLDRLTNVDRINLKNKTITIVDFDGAADYAEFYFSCKKRTNKITERPEFYSDCAKEFDFEKYNSELGCPFVLDSIKDRKDGCSNKGEQIIRFTNAQR